MKFGLRVVLDKNVEGRVYLSQKQRWKVILDQIL